MPTIYPTIPETITVHLGPPDSDAQNVTVSFVDYIKNVASSEIYPTWNEQAIYANILAQISYALNRVYTEFYRSKGYNFDITSSTAYDQKFIYERNIFENIDRIVDDIFDSYIRRIGFIEPLAAKYCNGTTVTCEGLSQWGSENLARQGLDYYSILTNYYGDNIEIVSDVPVSDPTNSYPGYPISRGDSGPEVGVIQTSLNRISENYPSIPKIYPVDGIFGEQTENSVKRFQEIFNLTPDGIVGKATWYKLVQLYVGILRLSELDSEGQTIFGSSLEYPDAISLGDRGEKVVITQYFLAVLSSFNNFIPPVTINGTYGPQTENAVISFQKNQGLPQTGVVDEVTWNAMYDAVKGIADSLNVINFSVATYEKYPGSELTVGTQSSSVRTLQEYLNVISLSYQNISPVPTTGLYSTATERSVRDYQEAFSLPVTGVVNEETWNSIGNTYVNLISEINVSTEQYPGFPVKEGDEDSNLPQSILIS